MFSHIRTAVFLALLVPLAAQAAPPVNLALGKHCEQSSRSQWSKPNDAQGAVDGVRNGGFGFHTNKEQSPWWQVDLGQRYHLTDLAIYNRLDCCAERAQHLTVLLSDDGAQWQEAYVHRGPVFGGKDGKELRVPLRRPGRFVRLQLADNQYFHLDEVEVFGLPESHDAENLALNKATSTSSRSQWSKQDDGHGAVDGVINGKFGFHTSQQADPWWQVDLGDAYDLSEIVAFNRLDCCAERAQHLVALLSTDGQAWEEVYAHQGGAFGGKDGNPLHIPLTGRARYVRLQLRDNQFFHLDEVQVFGERRRSAQWNQPPAQPAEMIPPSRPPEETPTTPAPVEPAVIPPAPRQVEVAPAPTGPVAISEADFAAILKAIKAAGSFSDNKLGALRTAASGRFFTADQVGRVVGMFTFSPDKIEVVKTLKSSMVDPQNGFKLLQRFTFSDDKKKVEAILHQ